MGWFPTQQKQCQAWQLMWHVQEPCYCQMAPKWHNQCVQEVEHGSQKYRLVQVNLLHYFYPKIIKPLVFSALYYVFVNMKFFVHKLFLFGYLICYMNYWIIYKILTRLCFMYLTQRFQSNERIIKNIIIVNITKL